MGNGIRSEYWQQVRSLTFRLLLVWVLLILGVVLITPYFKLSIAGVPLTYGLISSVLLLFFLVLIMVFAVRMDRLESKHYKNAQELVGETNENQSERGERQS